MAGAIDLLNVGTCAESLLASASQHDHPYQPIVRQLLPDRRQALLGGEVERIQDLRPVNRNPGDAACALLENDGHEPSSDGFGASPTRKTSTRIQKTRD